MTQENAHGYIKSESISDMGNSMFVSLESIDFLIVKDANGTLQGLIVDPSILITQV
jgi:hypothetical protein